jgi:hypothetical protein
MSLINDALKKAQRERSNAPEHPAAITPPPAAPSGAPRGELRAKGNPWPAILVAIALVGGGAAVWFLKPSGQPAPAAPAGTATVTANAPAPATPAPAPSTAPTPEAGQVQLQFTPPAGTPAAASTTPATSPVAAAPLSAPTPTAPAVQQPTPLTQTAAVAAAPAAVQPAPATAAPDSLKINLQMEDPRILAFLDAARIQGIRSVADDAKLLMNGKVFRQGAIVDRELGLKLVQILPTELVFEDAHGIQYRKIL